MKDTTVIVTTFERPKAVRRFLRSVRGFYPDIDIIVSDNGRNRPALVKDVVDKYKDRPLFVAASLGETRVVRELVNKGAKLNNKDANGNTALMLAATKGYKTIVSVLLANKTSV